MKKLTCIIFILIATNLIAQKTKYKDGFTFEKIKVKGDLNGDKIADVAIVTQDTLDDKRPYRLQIFFTEKDGKLKLVVSTTKAIEAEFPDGKEKGFVTGNEFDDLTIERGVLSINNGLLRGHFEHKFRFQHGKFELIGYSHNYFYNGTMGSTDFNLVTGKRVETEEHFDTALPRNTSIKKYIISPLPSLQDFKPFTNILYW